MPAANSIANHDRVENSGLASAPPSRILPTGNTISARQNSTKILALTMNSQSKYSIAQSLAPFSDCCAMSGKIKVPTTNATINSALIKNTGLCRSIPIMVTLSCPTS